MKLLWNYSETALKLLWNCSETGQKIVRERVVSPKAQTRTNKAKYISVREAAARYRIKPKRTHRL